MLRKISFTLAIALIVVNCCYWTGYYRLKQRETTFLRNYDEGLSKQVQKQIPLSGYFDINVYDENDEGIMMLAFDMPPAAYFHGDYGNSYYSMPRLLFKDGKFKSSRIFYDREGDEAYRVRDDNADGVPDEYIAIQVKDNERYETSWNVSLKENGWVFTNPKQKIIQLQEEGNND